MKKLILSALLLTFMIAPSLAWFDTGYPFRVLERINYTGNTTLYNFTYPVNSTRFNFGGIDTGDQTVWVKIPVLNPGINSQFLYYNDNYNYTSVATSDLTQNGMQVDIGNSSNVSSAWDSAYTSVIHMTGMADDAFSQCTVRSEVGSSVVFSNNPCPGFVMSLLDAPNTPSGNGILFSGTSGGSDDPFIFPSPIASYTSFTLDTVVLMNGGNIVLSDNDPGASDVYAQLTYAGSVYCTVEANQFGFMLTNTTHDRTCIAGAIPAPRTGTDYNLVTVTLGNNILSLYVNGELQNTTTYNDTGIFSTGGQYTIADDSVNFAGSQLIMDELSTSNIARSADWIKARYKSLLSNYDAYGITPFSKLGSQQVQNPSLNLTIQSPSGNYVGSVPMNLSVAFTTEGQLDTTSCSYQLDGNSPITISSCANTTLLAGSGSHSFVLFASSLDGASVNATSAFNVTRPASLNLTLISPSGNYNTSSLPLSLNISFTTQGQLNTSSCYYQRDGGTQTAIASCSTLAFSESAAGNHTIFVSASSLDGATANATSAYSVTVNAAPPSPATGKVTGISASILLLFPIFMALTGLLYIIRGIKTGRFVNAMVIGISVIIFATIIFALVASAT